jgi:hypothetical protein
MQGGEIAIEVTAVNETSGCKTRLVEDAIASLTEPAVLQPESLEHAGAERVLLLLGKQTPAQKYGAQDQVNTVIRCAQL